MPCSFLIVSQSDYLIHIVEINSHTELQTVQILKKPTDLDLQCLQRQGISGFSRTRVKILTSCSLSLLLASFSLVAIATLLSTSFSFMSSQLETSDRSWRKDFTVSNIPWSSCCRSRRRSSNIS